MMNHLRSDRTGWRPSDSALAVLDDSINTMMDRWQIPSVVYAVSSHGRIVHAQAYGLADVEL
jgi:hypothetical protein